jgi:hypothetical protein
MSEESDFGLEHALGEVFDDADEVCCWRSVTIEAGLR